MINEVRAKYRQIRREVFERATKPLASSNNSHTNNKFLFQARVEEVCSSANLSNWGNPSSEARTALWNQLWTKNRYAGIRAQTASNEIAQLTDLFNNYKWFSDPGWNLESKGHTVQSAGVLAENFLKRSGQFKNIQAVSNVPKLQKIVTVARRFKDYFDEHPDAPAIEFVTRKLSADDTWAVHDQLMAGGYTADLTALHFMMDTGFHVIKPDVVISRLFLDWGWLHYAAPSLPTDVKRSDLVGKGSYGTKYLYTKPLIYKPVINLARKVVEGINPEELSADIGWVTTNPIREFDIFVVKAGQLPETGYGIESRLYP